MEPGLRAARDEVSGVSPLRVSSTATPRDRTGEIVGSTTTRHAISGTADPPIRVGFGGDGTQHAERTSPFNAVAAAAGVVATSFTGPAADPRHVDRGAPGGQPGGRPHPADRRGVPDAHRRRLVLSRSQMPSGRPAENGTAAKSARCAVLSFFGRGSLRVESFPPPCESAAAAIAGTVHRVHPPPCVTVRATAPVSATGGRRRLLRGRSDCGSGAGARD